MAAKYSTGEQPTEGPDFPCDECGRPKSHHEMVRSLDENDRLSWEYECPGEE